MTLLHRLVALCCSKEVWCHSVPDPLLPGFLDAAGVVPISVLLTFQDNTPFSFTVLSTWPPFGFWGYSYVRTMNWLGSYVLPPLHVLGFTFLALQDSCHLSLCFLPPQILVWYVWFGIAFFPLFLSLYLFYSSSVIFVGFEERSEINVFVQPVMFKWKARWLTVFSIPLNSELLPKDFPERWGKGGQRGRSYLNYFSFAPSFTELGYHEQALGTKFCFLVTCSICGSPWWWHSWEALMGIITQLGEGFLSYSGKELDYCLLTV